VSPPDITVPQKNEKDPYSPFSVPGSPGASVHPQTPPHN
jgi:hypothetical protein